MAADKQPEQQAVFPQEANPDVPAGTPPHDENPAAGSQADRGIVVPAPGDGTNTGETTPQWGPEPGVTGIDRGSDPGVPAFIPDLVGPRTDVEHAAPSADDRAAEAEAVADRARDEAAAGERAARPQRTRREKQ